MTRIRVLAAVGWLVGLAIVGLPMVGVGFTDIAGLAGNDAHASSQALSEGEAAEAAEAWATSYLAETLGTQVVVDDRPLVLTDMTRVDLRLVQDTARAMTSIDSAVVFGEKKDFWVVSWERGGVDNVTTGQPDGTAYLNVVVADGTGKILSSGAGIRQPEDQAKARDPLPTFDERFGEFWDKHDSQAPASAPSVD
ncbi:MAG: hypothetical protein ACSLFM_04775 [Tepidiformaceae bacterium]